MTPAANIVLNRYLNETRRAEDLDALAALPLFLSLRAAIRAKVTAARRAQGAERAGIEQSARDYFALAGKLLAPPPPHLVAVGGLSGTGKSLLARALAADILARAGRGGAAQRRRAQGVVRHRRNRPPAAGRLCAARSRHKSTPRSPTRRGG